MRFDIISLFPDMIEEALQYGVVGRAMQRERLEVAVWNPRDFTTDRHRTVDDRPYGGGPGMVMKVQPLRAAIQAARDACRDPVQVIYLSPQGRLLDQTQIVQWSRASRLMLVAGRYEGVDERLVTLDVDEEWSIGDYVLSGGELAALVVVDAISRMLPGVLGDDASSAVESHMQGLLDWPHFTRPEEVAGLRVPDVLVGGDHAAVDRWRRKQALGRTWLRRPELLARYGMTAAERRLLDEFKFEYEIAQRG